MLSVILVAVATTAASPLTLDDAIALALERHEDPKISDQAVAAANAQFYAAFARLLPQLSVSGTFSRRPDSITVNGVDVSQNDETLAASGSARWRLVDFGAVPGIMAARRNELASELDAQQSRRTLAFTTARQFFAVLTSEAIARAASQRVQAADAAVSDARVRVSAGVGRPANLTRAALEAQAARLAARQSRRDVELARLTLAILLGEESPEVASQPLAQPERIRAPGELTLKRPDILSLIEKREALALTGWDNWAGFLPSLNLLGRLNFNENPGAIGRSVDWSLVLSVDWSLFEGGSRIASGFENRARVAGAQLGIDRQLREATLGVQRGRVQLDAAEEALGIATRQVELAEDNASAVQKLFEGGVGTALQQVDANAAVFEARTEMAQHTLAVSLAELDILERAGRWPSGEWTAP